MSNKTIFLAIGMTMLSAQKALKDNNIDESTVMIITNVEEAEKYLKMPEIHISTHEIKMPTLECVTSSLDKSQKQQFYKPYHNKFTKRR